MLPFDQLLTHAPASVVLLALIVAGSLAGFAWPRFSDRFLLHPFVMFRAHQYERLLTSGFLHADLMHLLFNLFALYSVAMYLEAATGTVNFLVIYLASLLLSGIVPAVRRRNDPSYRALGASGAVSALFFSGMLYFPEAKVMLLFLPIPMPWPVFAVLFVAASVYGARKRWDNVAHDVHLYGAAAGLLLTIALDPPVLGHFLAALGVSR
ncbi:MAG: rhomboid family intramembrane serine protease [Bacteroidota bacterium]|jgi:membrane associated rhomboid family serine protease|nr:rhomboid family intramembrane serine protease [Bacteroidota bacterium]